MKRQNYNLIYYAALASLTLMLYSCTYLLLPYRQDFKAHSVSLYDKVSGGIDSLININGFYTLKGVSRMRNWMVKPSFVFYADGTMSTVKWKDDLPVFSNIPNIVYLAPTCKEEYLKMLDYALEQTEHPVVIRVPFGAVVSSGKVDETDYSLLNKFDVVEEGSDIAIIGLGNFYHLGKKVKEQLKSQNINATLINPKFITGVDEIVLNKLKGNHKLVITLEDGCVDGGFGEKISRFYGNSDVKVLNFGGKKEFTDRVPLNVLYKRYHLIPELIVDDIKKCL